MNGNGGGGNNGKKKKSRSVCMTLHGSHIHTLWMCDRGGAGRSSGGSDRLQSSIHKAYLLAIIASRGALALY